MVKSLFISCRNHSEDAVSGHAAEMLHITLVQVVKTKVPSSPVFLFLARVSEEEEAGVAETSGRERGASAQANGRDSRARGTGPQI